MVWLEERLMDTVFFQSARMCPAYLYESLSTLLFLSRLTQIWVVSLRQCRILYTSDLERKKFLKCVATVDTFLFFGCMRWWTVSHHGVRKKCKLHLGMIRLCHHACRMLNSHTEKKRCQPGAMCWTCMETTSSLPLSLTHTHKVICVTTHARFSRTLSFCLESCIYKSFFVV